MTNYEMICLESKTLLSKQQEQVLQFIRTLSSGDEVTSAENTEDSRFSATPQQVESKLLSCPHCAGTRVIRFGHKCGKQRYLCKECDKLFVTTTKTVLENSHCCEDDWKQVISDTLDGFVSIDKTAQNLGLSHSTVFHMRHKILMALEAHANSEPTLLKNISELDETYVLEDQKGTKMSTNAMRGPRKHGAKAAKRGISNEQICIMTGVERNGSSAYAVTLNRAHPSNTEIITAFQDHIDTGSVVFTDGLKGYKNLETVVDCVVECVSTEKQKNAGTANLNHVNNFHSYIQERYAHYRGVATRYINRYNSLFAAAYRAKASLENIIDAILHGTNTGVFSYWDVHNSSLVSI